MKCKKAFTMIEVIFIIVIIGILSVIALPKLAANRNDAEASKTAIYLADCINMAMASYTKTSYFDLNSTSCLRATIDRPCYTLEANDNEGILVVTDGDATPICLKSQEISASNHLSSPSGVSHQF